MPSGTYFKIGSEWRCLISFHRIDLCLHYLLFTYYQPVSVSQLPDFTFYNCEHNDFFLFLSRSSHSIYAYIPVILNCAVCKQSKINIFPVSALLSYIYSNISQQHNSESKEHDDTTKANTPRLFVPSSSLWSLVSSLSCFLFQNERNEIHLILIKNRLNYILHPASQVAETLFIELLYNVSSSSQSSL